MQGNKAKMRYEYDNYQNVIKAVTQVEDASGNIVDGIEYNFVYDTYGNNISANIGGQGGITTTATYTPDGNRLLTTKDELANVTTYCYNEDTNVLEWVKYPNDTDATRTNYTYDELYRMATASAAVPGLSDGTALTASYTYEDDLLTEIQTASTSYEFAYGYFGVRTGVRIGSDYLALYEYTAKNRYLEAIEYGNGHVTGYEYDKYGRLIEETFDDGSTVTYTYDNTGALATMTDSATGRKTTYYYDLIDRLVKYTEVGSNYNHSVEYIYDARNNLTQLKETVNGVEKIMDYIYDDQNRIKSVTINGVTRTYAYDAYGRVSSKNFSGHGGDLGNIDYYYVQSGNLLSSRVDTIHTVFDNLDLLFIYTHDANGNILSFTDETNTDTYAYDSANQLIRENNLGAGKTWTWTYDNAGNILAKNEYAYTTSDLGTPIDTILYTYGDSSWGDLLTAYDGIAITHDAIGNPLNDGTWTYTWQNGRDLAAMTDGTTTWNYIYDANGMRTQRSNGTTAYNYVYNGSQLSQMTVGSNMLNFAYDASGMPMMVTYNGTNYYYIVNLQGDVMGIVDSTGTLVVYYTYDAWGNPLSITGTLADSLGTLNPLRYRGYVYDVETDYYYLQSRYYDPEIGRFINSDAFVATGQGLLGNNMFAYCGNNPVSRYDPTGKRYCMVHVYDGGGGGAVTTKESNTQSERDEVTVGSKLLSTASLALQSIDFSAGLGQGLYAEFDILDTVGIGVGMYGNYGTINYADGEFYGGQELYIGLTGTMLWYELGAADHWFRDSQGQEQTRTFIGLNTEQDSLTLFSFACYPLFAGFSVYIGFDTVSFFTGLDDIW